MIRAKDRPKSEKDLKKEHKDNQNAAKKAADMVEDLAKKVGRDEGIDKDDLEEHIKDLLDDSCRRGGSSGTGWAEECLFTKKGSSYVVKGSERGGSARPSRLFDPMMRACVRRLCPCSP